MKQFLMILLIFFFASLVSAFINMNSSFSDNEREFDVKWNSSLNFELPDHSKPTFDDSVTNFIWIIFGVFTVSTLLFGCFCCLVICWMIYGVQTGGGYGGHHGLRYGGYGQPLMPFGHRYDHRSGLFNNDHLFDSTDRYRHHMNLANRYDRRHNGQTESLFHSPTHHSSRLDSSFNCHRIDHKHFHSRHDNKHRIGCHDFTHR